jgi:hypothetical protein
MIMETHHPSSLSGERGADAYQRAISFSLEGEVSSVWIVVGEFKQNVKTGMLPYVAYDTVELERTLNNI